MYTPDPGCFHYFEFPHINSTECINCNKERANWMIEKINEVNQSLGIPQEVYNIKIFTKKIPYIHYLTKRKAKLHDYPQIVEVSSLLPFETMTAINWNNLFQYFVSPDYIPEFLTEIENLHILCKEVSFENDEYSYLSNVKSMYINGWTFEYEEDYQIFSLEKLDKLSLGNCLTRNIPDEVVKDSPVTDLYMWLKRNIPTWLPNLKNLTKLDIISPKDKKFPYFIPDCEKLTSLEMQIPNVSHIPGDHLLNQNLEHLYIYGSSAFETNLKSIPAGIGQNTSLQSLVLNNLFTRENNPSGTIPDFIYELTELKHLFLNQNELNSISDKILKLEELISLSIRQNKFSSIPSILSSLDNLSAIYIDEEDEVTVPNDLEEITYRIKRD